MPESRPNEALADVELAILTFEHRRWKFAGAKDAAIREQFDLSATRYYQVLNAVIDCPEALAHDPMGVRRLRRLRDARRATRAGGNASSTAK